MNKYTAWNMFGINEPLLERYKEEVLSLLKTNKGMYITTIVMTMYPKCTLNTYRSKLRLVHFVLKILILESKVKQFDDFYSIISNSESVN